MARLRQISIVLGILLGIFSWNAQATSLSKLTIPHLPVGSQNENSVRAEYATYKPYKIDFDLLRSSDKSHELEMPLLRTNEVDRGSSSFEFDDLESDPTLRSRRRRRQVLPVVQNPEFQRFSLCHPYFNVNPMCRQMFLGLPPSTAAGGSSSVALPSSASTYYLSSPVNPSSSFSSSSTFPRQLSRNDLAINYYYQQQQPSVPQLLSQKPIVPLQVSGFQGPVAESRQRQSQYENIHVKYPYPYPPALESSSSSSSTSPPAPSSPQAIVPESGGSEGVTTGGPEVTAPPAQESVPDSDASVVIGHPVSPQEDSQPPQSPPSSSPTPPPLPPSAPPPSPSPHSPSRIPSSPDQDDPAPHLPTAHDIAMLQMQKRLKEKEDEVRQLQQQFDQANQQVVAYEQENSQLKDQFVRSEEANVKLRDRVLTLENTNQHLQEQNGQLQQVTAEQRTQVTALKLKAKDAKEQLELVQQQYNPLSKEVQQHRKEIEDFLIRIRKLGEENETCKKQVKLYQLKVNYIQDQQQSDDKDAGGPDAELARMDAEIAALQQKEQEVAAALENLEKQSGGQGVVEQEDEPQPTGAPESGVVASKQENEFPGEAIQVNPQRPQQQPPQEKVVATAADVARAQSASRSTGVWEQPSGF